MRAWALFVFVAGCYAPHPAPGSPCASPAECPGGLTCQLGACVVPGTPVVDAPRTVDAPAQVVVDAPVLDAPVDAIDTSLVAHWAFDDDPADGALDSTGHGHLATCETACPTLVTGKLGSGYRFDPAMNEDLIVPDSSDFRGNFTITAWVWADPSATDLSVMAKPVGTASDDSWQLELRATDTMSFSGGSVHYLESPALTRQAWHHIAATYDGTTKRLYVDGAAAASVASVNTFDTHSIWIGADQNSGTTVLRWSGVLDDLRVYSRVLSVSEIAALAQ